MKYFTLMSRFAHVIKLWIGQKGIYGNFDYIPIRMNWRKVMFYYFSRDTSSHINLCLYSRKVKTRYINTYIHIDFFNHWKNKYTKNSNLKFVWWKIAQTHSFSFHKIKKNHDKDNDKYLSCSWRKQGKFMIL